MNKPRLRRKRGQTEVLGLAIVIILIMVGILFVVKFALREQPSEARQTFTSAEIASNLANTLLETTIPTCHDLSIRILLQDCAKSPENIDCDNDHTPDSCWNAAQRIEDLLFDTLVVWDRPFVFNITRFPGSAQLFFHEVQHPLSFNVHNDPADPLAIETAGIWVHPDDGTNTQFVPDGDFPSRETKIFTIPLNPGELFVRVDLYS